MKETSISLFKGYSDTHPQDSTLQEIVNLIRNDALVRDRTEKHRYYSHNGQKAAAAWEKAACPCFAVAVCFGGGKQAENITGWTSQKEMRLAACFFFQSFTSNISNATF